MTHHYERCESCGTRLRVDDDTDTYEAMPESKPPLNRRFFKDESVEEVWARALRGRSRKLWRAVHVYLRDLYFIDKEADQNGTVHPDFLIADLLRLSSMYSEHWNLRR